MLISNVFFFVILGPAVVSIYFIKECWYLPYQNNSIIQTYENHTLIISEIVPAVSSKFSIAQSVRHGDASHLIVMYLVDSGCQQLPTYYTEMKYSSNTTLHNISVVYLLGGSIIDYNITARTDNVQEVVDLFVVQGIDNILGFDPSNDNNYLYSKRILVYPPGIHYPLHFDVSIPDYYAYFILYDHKAPVEYSFNATLQIGAVDKQQLEDVHSYMLIYDGDKWEQNLGIERCSHRKCLIADITSRRSYPYYETVHLVLEFSSRSDVLHGLVAIYFLLAILLLLSCILCSVCDGFVLFICSVVIYYKKRGLLR